MGLDSVELVIAVEEEFKIAISDTDAARCATVGKLVDHVYSRLRQSSGEPCPSQHGFYIARKRMMDLLGLKRPQIRPETRLEDLIGRTHRRTIWRNLIASVTEQKNTWPSLVRPKWMTFLIILLIPVAVCISIVTSTLLPLALALPLATALAFLRDTALFKQQFPAEFSQVQDLIKLVNTLDSKVWSKDEVFRRIKKITADTLGIKESRVTPDASFIDDLGVE